MNQKDFVEKVVSELDVNMPAHRGATVNSKKMMINENNFDDELRCYSFGCEASGDDVIKITWLTMEPFEDTELLCKEITRCLREFSKKYKLDDFITVYVDVVYRSDDDENRKRETIIVEPVKATINKQKLKTYVFEANTLYKVAGDDKLAFYVQKKDLGPILILAQRKPIDSKLTVLRYIDPEYISSMANKGRIRSYNSEVFVEKNKIKTNVPTDFFEER